MTLKTDYAKNQIARIENRIKEYKNDFEKLERVFDSSKNAKTRSNLGQVLAALQEEIEGARGLIKVYKKDLEGKS